MATPRPTRSRISSPAIPALVKSTKESADSNANTRPKTFMDNWVEPPIPAPRPSFAEAGIERHGVVANMAPLGTRPSAKVMKSLIRPDLAEGGGRSKRRETSVASTPAESIMTQTPEPTTNHSRRSLSAKTEELPASPPPQTPQLPPSLPQATRTSLPYHSPATLNNGQGVFALHQSPAPSVIHMARPTPPFIRPTLPLPPIGPDGEFMVNLDQTDAVMEEAVQKALDDRRWPTAYALRTLYDDHRTNNRMVRLIEAIYGGFATPPQQIEFRTIMRHKKREGKKDRTAEYYFNGDGSDPLPQRPSSSSLYSAINLAQYQTPPTFTTPVYQTPYTPLGGSAGAATSFSDPAARRRSSLNQSSVPASPRRDQDHAQHVSKKHKGNDFEPSDVEVNGNGSASANGGSAPPQPNGSSKSAMNRASRSGSESSTSSLSSIDEQLLGGSEFNSPAKIHRPSSSSTSNHASGSGSGLGLAGLGLGLGLDGRISGGGYGALFGSGGATPQHISPYTSANNFAAAAAETLAGTPGASNQIRPITTQPKTGPKTFTFSTVPTPAPSSSANNNLPNANANHHAPSSSSNNTTTTTTTTTTRQKSNSSMAPVALLASSNSSSTTTTTTTTTTGNPPPLGFFKTKGTSKAQLPPPIPYDANDTNNRLKRKAREITNRSINVSESNERHQIQIPEAESDADSVAVKPTKRPPKVRLLNREAKQRYNNNYDSEENSSPTLLSFQPDLAPGSVSTSRAGTPNNFNRPTRKPKTGTGLRVKTSPMKKKGGTLAGIPRASGERNSPTGGSNGVSHNQDDNDDYCSSCGGNGDLVCCDGCTRSFHFKCVDPPMIEGSLPDEWFCNVCQSTRQPRREDEPGLFGPLLSNLSRKNPSAFHLPKSIRECFEGVKTGTEGEYEETAPPKTKNRAGWDEQPDYFRTKDTKGKTIFCHHCQTTASVPDRMVIPCSFCGLYWHLDCLPNPLAKEPGPGRQWRCPLHVDDLLAQLPAMLAPAHRFRKIKGASAIKPAISRGIRNNGHIEIENAPSDDEEEQGFFEQKEYGHVYKLPEQGVKLDFISKVKKQGGGQMSRLISRPRPAPSQPWDQRGIQEKQAALNLASLVSQTPDTTAADALVNALLAGADESIISFISRGDASNMVATGGKLTKETKQSLIALQARIASTLAAATNEEAVMQNGETDLTSRSPPQEPEPEPEPEPGSKPETEPENENQNEDTEMVL